MRPDDGAIWDAYNLLMLGPDVERLRKLLARYEMFKLSLDVPGDIVECGVFKGTGLMFWLKLLSIYCPGSAKRVVGLDTFAGFNSPSDTSEAEQVKSFVKETGFEGITTDSLCQKIDAAGIDRARCDLVEGDIVVTAQEYVSTRPGFRISLLHLDLDLEDATLAALDAFWPRVAVGGVAVFDEYAVSRWTESNAVDNFFRGKGVKLRSLPWARTPTAYMLKDR